MNLAQMLLMARPLKPSYSSVILATPGLAAYWPMNETSGTTVEDLSGNGWTGTIVGGVTLASVAFPAGGSGMTFNGSTGYIYGDSGVPTPSITSGASLEVWVNYGDASSTFGCMIKCGGSSGTGGSNDGYGLGNGTYWNSGFDISGLYENSAWLNTTSAIPASGWNHLVMTIESNGTANFYINGSLVDSISGNTPLTPTASWSIGADYPNVSYFPHTLAQCAMYSATLTASQVLSHYNAGIA